MSQQIDMDAVIEELRKGWAKGLPLDSDDSTCLLGAVARVLGRKPTEWAGDEVEKVGTALFNPVIQAHFPERIDEFAAKPWRMAWAFNDHRDTTLHDVILVCEKARAAQGECHE